MRVGNKGFTMIELLAAIIVLGILMGTAVPTVINIMNDQKNDTYIEDAIRLASNADYKMRSDNKINIPPRNGGCVVITLSYMDNNAFEKAPYGGKYDKQASFVVASRNVKDADEEYQYYVVLIEETESGGFRGVNLVESNLLYEENARETKVENVGSSALIYPASYNAGDLVTALRSISSGICPKGISGIYFSEQKVQVVRC